MSRFIKAATLTVAITGSAAGLSAAAWAGPTWSPDPVCGAPEVGATGLYATPPQVPPSGDSTIQVCDEAGPAGTAPQGTVSATGTAGPGGASGYVVADGNNSNTAPSNGYLGVQGTAVPGGTSDLQVVGCSTGTYDPNYKTDQNPYGSDNVIFDTSSPSAPSTNSSGPCAFATPLGPVSGPAG